MEPPPVHLWEVQICKSEYSRSPKYCFFKELSVAVQFIEWLQQRKDRVYRLLSTVVPMEGARYGEAIANEILVGQEDYRKVILHS